MAGSNSGFDANAFRTGIRFVMDLGAPPDSGEQAVFLQASTLVYNIGADPAYTDQEGVPFDPSSTVTRNVPDPIKVPCAVEYFDARGEPTNFGLVTPSRAVITLLDEDYQTIKDCVAVVLRGERFNYRSTEYPVGLFDVGVYVTHWTAEDES